MAAPPTTPAPHLPADDTDGVGRECAGAAAARLATSSSSTRFFVSAWRSLHVNLPLEPTAGRAGADWAAKTACARASNGLLSFFGRGSETGVYAVPCKERRDHDQYILRTDSTRDTHDGADAFFFRGLCRTVRAGDGLR